MLSNKFHFLTKHRQFYLWTPKVIKICSRISRNKIYLIKMQQNNLKKSENGVKLKENNESSDFEAAISATGFGKFNILLFLVALPSAWSSEFGFTALSYVLPAAQCDLQLSLLHKGWLNAVTYLGTIASAFLWGFLADTRGRRKIMIYAFLIDSFFVLLSALSQNFWILFTLKFINGFLVGGPYAVLMSYISEFHCARYRAPILLLSCIFYCLANVALSALAWWIIPKNISLSLFAEFVEIRSWQVFLMICALPSFVSGCAYIFLPESPKFLMTSGRNVEAMKVFQQIYTINTGNPKEQYPIKHLLEEILPVENEKGKAINVVQEGWKQIRPIFAPPYLTRIVHIFFNLFLGMLGENTLRLWMPQLFTKIDEYNQMYNYSQEASLCEMLNVSIASSHVEYNNHTDFKCTVITVDNQVYINTITVAMANVLGFIVASIVVNKIGKKVLLVIMYLMCGFSGIGNYWSPNATSTLILVSIYGGVSSVCTSTMISIMVDLFPTTLRTMTISLGMMTGRSGSIIGNVLFPVLLEAGCLPPFLLIGGTTLVCAVSALFLPNLKLKSLD